MVSILRKGYKLVFIETPKLSPVPIFFQPPKLPQKVILLEMEINKLIEKRAVEFAPPGTPGYYSHMFLVSKGDKWRPIIDLSVLNTMLWIPSFHMETTESIHTAIQLNDWTVSIDLSDLSDLSDAFLHIPSQCKRSEISQICIQRRKSAIQSTAFRACDKPVVVYPDNDRGENHSFTKRHNYSPVLGRLADKISEQTSTAEPNRVVTSPMQNPRAYPTQKRIEQIQQKATLFLNSQALPAREWLSLTGLLTATEKLVPMGRTHMRDLQYCLKRQWKQTETNLNQSVQIDHLAHTELRWWYDATNLIVGAPHAPSESGHSDFHGLLDGGLGSPYTEPGSVWGMVVQRENITHKQFRATF